MISNQNNYALYGLYRVQNCLPYLSLKKTEDTEIKAKYRQSIYTHITHSTLYSKVAFLDANSSAFSSDEYNIM